MAGMPRRFVDHLEFGGRERLAQLLADSVCYAHWLGLTLFNLIRRHHNPMMIHAHAQRNAADDRTCDWPGCTAHASHRAPKDRERLEDYYWFCLQHVREYNGAWDYFAGMENLEYESLVRSSATWERPTWPLGNRGGDREAWTYWAAREAVAEFADSPEPGARRVKTPEQMAGISRLTRQDRQALATLELPETATLQDIKKRFKQLVKRYHPDATGPAAKPSRAIEERLRNVIQAYSQLKASGLFKDNMEESR
ncbi:MAG: DnaJ domain-containing protein [Alphaproteobacteria bacterium]|nr:DnaJ domain-containing protein [Alphaproteobacteria bacterium]